MSDELLIDRDDVSIKDLFPGFCDSCNEAEATRAVMVNFRSAGMESCIGTYCLPCAEEVQRRIREGLPEVKSDGR